jgi:hypothetical protein
LSQKAAGPAPAKSSAPAKSTAPAKSESSGKSAKAAPDDEDDDDTTAQEDAIAGVLASLMTLPVAPPSDPAATAATPTIDPLSADAPGALPNAANIAPATGPNVSSSAGGLTGVPILTGPAASPATDDSAAATSPSAPGTAGAAGLPASAPAGVVLRSISVDPGQGTDGLKLTDQAAAALANATGSEAKSATLSGSVPPAVPAQPGTTPPAASQPATIGAVLATEKIAAASAISPKPGDAAADANQKKSLTIDKKGLVCDDPDLGINAAQGKAVMPTTATPPPSPASPEHASLAAIAPASGDAPKEGSPLPAPVAAQVATHAVDTAMAAADRLTAGVQRSVNLQFSVSGVDLGVRVEMCGDTVHTTFHTDSPELRTAITHEWQAVTAQNEARPQRLASPVFSAGPHSGLGQSGDGSAHQRDPGARQGQAAGSAFTVSRPGARSAATATVAASSVSSRLAPSHTTRHLHTFA